MIAVGCMVLIVLAVAVILGITLGVAAGLLVA